MSTTRLPDRPQSRARSSAWPGLYPGDHLDQPTFHALYEAAPEGFKAELIEGVVMVPLSVSAGHARDHHILSTWLGNYETSTPGTSTFIDPTIILGPKSEPQPDLALLILPECGGQSRVEGKNLAGPPELVVEVAYSSHAHDLHSKYRDYERAGVREYLVLVDRQEEVRWFISRDKHFAAHTVGEDGLIRSEVFPGLWLDPAALLAQDAIRVQRALQLGLATPEHAEFVRELQARRLT